MTQWPEGYLCDRLTQPLYDTVRAKVGGRTRMFHEPVGTGSMLFGQGLKHFGDTNMFLAGQIPKPWNFNLRSIYLEAVGIIPQHDTALSGATLKLTIGSKSYLTIPFHRAQVTMNVDPVTVIVANSVLQTLKDVHASAAPMLLGMVPGLLFGYSLGDRKFSLAASHMFGVELSIPESRNDPMGDRVIRCYLNGELMRPVQ